MKRGIGLEQLPLEVVTGAIFDALDTKSVSALVSSWPLLWRLRDQPHVCIRLGAKLRKRSAGARYSEFVSQLVWPSDFMPVTYRVLPAYSDDFKTSLRRHCNARVVQGPDSDSSRRDYKEYGICPVAVEHMHDQCEDVEDWDYRQLGIGKIDGGAPTGAPYAVVVHMHGTWPNHWATALTDAENRRLFDDGIPCEYDSTANDEEDRKRGWVVNQGMRVRLFQTVALARAFMATTAPEAAWDRPLCDAEISALLHQPVRARAEPTPRLSPPIGARVRSPVSEAQALLGPSLWESLRQFQLAPLVRSRPLDQLFGTYAAALCGDGAAAGPVRARLRKALRGRLDFPRGYEVWAWEELVATSAETGGPHPEESLAADEPLDNAEYLAAVFHDYYEAYNERVAAGSMSEEEALWQFADADGRGVEWRHFGRTANWEFAEWEVDVHCIFRVFMPLILLCAACVRWPHLDDVDADDEGPCRSTRLNFGALARKPGGLRQVLNGVFGARGMPPHFNGTVTAIEQALRAS